jgi:uncharacterized C2H2 Zn-finger protein
MKRISISLLLLFSNQLALAMDAMSCDWEAYKEIPDYSMLIDQPTAPVSYPLPVLDTVIKLERIEEPYMPAPIEFLPELGQPQAMEDINSHNPSAPTAVKQEDSISEYIPLANPRKKRDRDASWNNGSACAMTPSRIPGRFMCLECPPERPAILRYKWGLTSHIKRVHRNITKWGCPFFNASKKCLTTFKTNSDYRRHLKDKHQTLYTEVQKRKLKKSDSQLLPNTRPSTFRAAVVALANRPHTRSITQTLKSEAQ